MSNFIHTGEGDLLNLDSIVCVELLEPKSPRIIVHLPNGDTISYLGLAAQRVLERVLDLTSYDDVLETINKGFVDASHLPEDPESWVLEDDGDAD